MNPKLFLNLYEEDISGISHNVPNARHQGWRINSLGVRGKEIDFLKKKEESELCV